ncbi:hypothetical protein B0T09DRAFT_260955 [Sordaria sp. MPI-SDFR-AT-0083]|nr:hypothetical protein B0T09DRAFT_260955 [Sordaria sp. MPI-SDFR-AT-0083]
MAEDNRKQPMQPMAVNKEQNHGGDGSVYVPLNFGEVNSTHSSQQGYANVAAHNPHPAHQNHHSYGQNGVPTIPGAPGHQQADQRPTQHMALDSVPVNVGVQNNSAGVPAENYHQAHQQVYAQPQYNQYQGQQYHQGPQQYHAQQYIPYFAQQHHHIAQQVQVKPYNQYSDHQHHRVAQQVHAQEYNQFQSQQHYQAPLAQPIPVQQVVPAPIMNSFQGGPAQPGGFLDHPPSVRFVQANPVAHHPSVGVSHPYFDTPVVPHPQANHPDVLGLNHISPDDPKVEAFIASAARVLHASHQRCKHTWSDGQFEYRCTAHA